MYNVRETCNGHHFFSWTHLVEETSLDILEDLNIYIAKCHWTKIEKKRFSLYLQWFSVLLNLSSLKEYIMSGCLGI